MGFRNVDRARQLNDFSNLMGGKISMSDLDGIYDCDGKGWLILETKYLSKEMPFSQQRMIERLVTDTSCDGDKLSIGVVVEHNISDCEENVLCGTFNVREYYYSNSKPSRWIKPNPALTFNELITLFYGYVEVHYEHSIEIY